MDSGRLECMDIIRETCESKVKKLYEIWRNVGHPDLESRAQVVCQNVEQLLDEMIEEEEESQTSLASDIENLLKEADELSRVVGADQYKIVAGLDDKSIPLLQVQKLLNDRLRDCRIIKEERMKMYESLLSKEQQLCTSIGIKKRPKISRVPKIEELEEFDAYIAKKLDEERELRQQYEETKKKIEAISTELGISPDSSVYKTIVSNSLICLSSQNMMLLKELHQDMELRLEKAKSESIELREKLSNLWERLQVKYEERDVFLQEYPGHSKRSIDALKAEIQKCEEQKRQNICKFVKAIREELAGWWEKCCFGTQQKQQFKSFYSDCYTEDLLELHEIEVEKLKKYFMDNLDILELAKKREKLWKKMMELDERAHDPKRLFANRGGQLLREEKERKAIQKDLPVIDKELNTFLDAYEDKHQMPFFYDGNNLRDVIRSKWDDFQKKKEDEKLARKKGKYQTGIDKTLSKRKLGWPNTAASVPSKIIKTAVEPVPSGSKVVRNIFDRKGRNGNIAQAISKPPKSRHGVHSPEASYSDFQNGLNIRADQEMVRSSVVPSRLLRERNARMELSSIKERSATPMKPPRKNSVT